MCRFYEDPIRQAEHELAQEKFRLAVEAEKARLRQRNNRTFWARVRDALPFTITWRKNP